MANRVALIFDTNFIIEHSKDLNSVVEKLSKSYEVFVTQLSIDERISQQYLDLKAKYDKASKLANEIHSFAKLEFLKEFDEAFKLTKIGVQNNYNNLFLNKIIPFSKSEETYAEIIDRVYKKTAPFISGNSDKGFKDTILWLSLIEYFSNNNNYESILFVSNDHGFTENIKPLQEEFKEKTKMHIEIQNNDFLNEMIIEKKDIEIKNSELKNITSEELNDLRQEIQSSLKDVCTGYSYDPDVDGYRSFPLFKLNEYLEINQIENMFENLPKVLFRDLFATEFVFGDLFYNLYIFKEQYYISREKIEALNSLYDKIKKNYNQLLPQFFKVVKETINQNYDVSGFPEDIPF